MKYRFPCERCGEKLVIDVSQAGRQIICRCGAALEVPSLRAIRALETAPDDSVRPRRPSWNLGRGVTFAGGLVIAMLGLLAAGAGGFGWLTAQAPPSPSPSDIEAALTAVDQLSAPALGICGRKCERTVWDRTLNPRNRCSKHFNGASSSSSSWASSSWPRGLLPWRVRFSCPEKPDESERFVYRFSGCSAGPFLKRMLNVVPSAWSLVKPTLPPR